jgi:hypothetical protein
MCLIVLVAELHPSLIRQVVTGTFDITDNMGVGPYGLALEPSGSVNVVVDAGSTDTHVFGTWSVATAALPPCGYVVHLTAWDRYGITPRGTSRMGRMATAR